MQQRSLQSLLVSLLRLLLVLVLQLRREVLYSTLSILLPQPPNLPQPLVPRLRQSHRRTHQRLQEWLQLPQVPTSGNVSDVTAETLVAQSMPTARDSASSVGVGVRPDGAPVGE
jgi:hypothetical protein